MNTKISQALGDNKSGDIINYFNEVDKIIELNDGIHDNKLLSMECYDRPTPVAVNQYTKFHLSDASIDCINIDKSFITASLTYSFKLDLSDASTVTFDTTSPCVEWFKLFIGLKSASHLFDTYRIYVNHQQIYSQTDSIYEQALVSAMKPKAEMYRPHMYTMWDEAHKESENVCGTYVKVSDVLNKSFTITFDVSIQIDDLLPFSGMSLFPNCVIGDIELEIRNRIAGNIVYCMVDPITSAKKNLLNITALPAVKTAYTNMVAFVDYAPYDHEFVQCGDEALILYATDSDTFQAAYVRLTCSNVVMTNAMSHINGFRLKDKIISQLRSKYSSKPLIIPAQHCNHDLFSQMPTSKGLKLNTNITLTNCTNIVLSFPQTPNQISVVHNPEQNAAQLIVMGKNIPDKAQSTLEAAHCENMLTNAMLDSLFEAQPSFINSLTKTHSNGSRKIKTDCDTSDYYFNASTERFGSGVFADGLTSPGAITLTFQSSNINQGSGDCYYHPYDNEPTAVNDNAVNIMTVEDCFWIITPDKVVITNDTYTPEITEAK